ncbi:MAG: AAA family ATPase [Verrucomicrobiota bacterium]
MSDLPPEVETLQQALALSPENTPLRRLLADALVRHGHFGPALEHYRECLRQSPEDSSVLLALADAYQRLGKNNESLVILEQLIEKDTPEAEAYHLHARLLAGAGQLAKAAESFAQAKSLQPELEDPELEETLREALRQNSPVHEEFDVKVPAGDLPEDFFTELEKPRIDFDSVGGMDEVKKQIRMKIILPLENPDLYQAYGKSAGGGVLLYGPPGCGKTLIARATAGQVNSGFMAIGIHEVLDMWIGQSERNLHALFEQARSAKPCVLFFDEVDALAASRTDMRQSAGRQLINQFLDELDGVNAQNDGLLILAATNAPWHLDPAFRRPGRFDRILFVPPPDEPARQSIFQIQLREKPLGEIDYPKLAKLSQHFSGADIAAAIDQTIEKQLEVAAETGQIQPLRTKELAQAIKRIKPSTKEWFATAKNHALYSNEGGHYDEILDYLKLR